MSVDRGIWSVAGTTTLDRECNILCEHRQQKNGQDESTKKKIQAKLSKYL